MLIMSAFVLLAVEIWFIDNWISDFDGQKAGIFRFVEYNSHAGFPSAS